MQTIPKKKVKSARRRLLLCHVWFSIYLTIKNCIVVTANNIAFSSNEEAIKFENGYHVIESQVLLCSLSKFH